MRSMQFIALVLLIVLDVRLGVVETNNGECDAIHIATVTHYYLCSKGE